MRTKDLPDNTQFVIMMTDYCEPTGTYIPRMNCPDWGGWGGANESDGYPATRPIFPTSGAGSKLPATRWKIDWVKYYRHLNRNNLRDAFDIANGIINNVNGQVQVLPPYDIDALPEMPKLENISCVGSIHIAEERTDERVRIRTWRYGDTPDQSLNFRNSVGIVKFTGIMRDTGILINLYSGATDCYWPLCIREGEAWIDSEEVEYFPPLGLYMVGDRPLIVRDGPGVEYTECDVVQAGEVVPINRYHPSGYDVWGNSGYGGWIPLRYQTTWGHQAYIEPTSWKLDTPPGCKPWAYSIDGEYGYVSPYAEDEPVEPPEEEDVLYQVEVIVGGLNVRSGPSTDYNVLFVSYLGDVLNVYEERDGWIRIGPNEWCSGHEKYVKRIDVVEPPQDCEEMRQVLIDELQELLEQMR